MGLDQYMNVVSGGGKEYYWRKHSRLQVFMARKWAEQNKGKTGHAFSDFDVGFNGGDEPVKLTRELCDEWEKQIKDNYWDNFASDGFFWGQQFQEESIKEYKKQDKEACDWARATIEKGKDVVYSCSW